MLIASREASGSTERKTPLFWLIASMALLVLGGVASGGVALRARARQHAHPPAPPVSVADENALLERSSARARSPMVIHLPVSRGHVLGLE